MSASYCRKDGPPEVANLAVYVPLPGMSLWFSSCGASITTPNDTEWHALESQLSDAIGVPVSISMSTVDSGAVTLRFASLDQLDLISARVAGESMI